MPSLSSSVEIAYSFLFFLSILSSMGAMSMADSKISSMSIYEVLSTHGLPMGLLPKGIDDFELDEASGRFSVRLDQACNAKFESQLHYDRNVTGILSYGQISSLSGISAQEIFLWFPVKVIRVDVPSSGRIYFDVGVVFKQFSLSLFETPPDCVAVQSPIDSESKSQPQKLGYGVNQQSFGRDIQKLGYGVNQQSFGRDIQ